MLKLLVWVGLETRSSTHSLIKQILIKSLKFSKLNKANIYSLVKEDPLYNIPKIIHEGHGCYNG